MNGAEPVVVLDAIRKAYGSTIAIDDVSLSIEPGEFLTLLGPSGSGKTTCLRVIAGMIRPDRGRLTIAGRDVSAVPMHRRNIGMVFQNYSLFPHMTVAQNVAYPLRVRGVGGAEAARRVGAALELIRLSAIGARRPDQLSGGQQQRVALARALVFEPDVLLLDEPLSALDRVLREEMQFELRRIHREVGKTMVCVTHDRSEALTMADRIVVMRAGKVVQDAAPREIYERSNSRFVAEFLGETNLLPMLLRRDNGRAVAVDVIGRTLPLPGHAAALAPGPIEYVIRVESVLLRSPEPGDEWQGAITEITFLGDAVRYSIACDPHALIARVPLALAGEFAVGSAVCVDFSAAKPMVFRPQ